MRKNKDPQNRANELRTRAEKIAGSRAPAIPENLQALTPQAAGELLHSLRVHQIELEMQNDELRMAQEKLEGLRTRYFELYDLAPVGYFSINEAGMIMEANLTGANLLGVAPSNLRAQPFSSFIVNEDRDIYYLHRKRLFEDGAPQVCEMRMLRSDAPIFWARVEAAIGQDGIEGKPVCRATLSDITEHKREAERLLESEKRYRDTIDFLPVSIFEVDAAMNLLAYNQTARKVFGYGEEDYREGMSALQFLSPEEWQRIVVNMAKVIDGTSIPGEEYNFRRKDGSTFKGLIYAAPNNQGDKPAGIRGAIVDITDRKRLDEERQRVQKLESVGLLAGGIAHDFNNILTSILGNISLARMEAAPGSELGENLEQAEKASLRAKDLTRQLLTFSRGGAPVRKLATLTELLKDTAGFALHGSNVKCKFSIPGDLWHAEIDVGQVSQVIHNLVINAQQSMPSGGTVEISAENMAISGALSLGKGLPLAEGDYVSVAITDHGGGIPKDLLEQIFDPFFTTKQTGSGLGLATSYSIARQHGGHLSVESEVGSGSTFHLYLPASTHTAIPGQPDKDEVKYTGTTRILVLDDEQAVREVTGRMLRRLGYVDVEFAADGSEAVSLYKAARDSGRPFSIAMLDLTIAGGMGGLDTVRHLLEINPAVRAIVSSGYADDPVIANYREYGFSGVVTKPYTPGELGKVIHDLLE